MRRSSLLLAIACLEVGACSATQEQRPASLAPRPSVANSAPPPCQNFESGISCDLLERNREAQPPKENERQSKHGLKGKQAENAVPPFELTDLSGTSVSSQELVGQQAFAVVFFATWCELCGRKMPLIRRAVEKTEGVRVLFVAVDTSDTWSHIPGFMREQRLHDAQVINGLEFPEFVQGYNPVSSIPLIAVVGRDGALVDYQIGLHEDDGQRLEASLRSAVE